MSPSRLGDYELGEVLGVGTVGTIYRAVDRRTGEEVAVKRLHPNVSENKLIRARFRREMAVLERLNHPNIIQYRGGGEEDGQLYYAMELVEGGTVKDLLQSRGAFPWPMVVDISRQVCSALQHAHNHGVIHRDLKPGNLFLTSDAQIKLGDFGIARDLHGSDLTTSGMTVGTHAYMAPEQITGETSVSGKADLYSLGCSIFEMLVGRQLFYGENFAQLLEQHLRAEPPHLRNLVPDCPEQLDQIVHQLLAKNPDDRPFNARQVQSVMLELDETRPIEDAEPGAPPGGDQDVAAGGVTSRGHELLKDHVRWQMAQTSPAEVGWGKLAVMMIVIVAVILVAMMFGK